MNDSQSAFFSYNGEKIEKSTLPLSDFMYSFYYGGSFFETIRIQNGKIPLLKYHLLRIQKAFDVFGYKKFSLVDLEEHLSKILKFILDQKAQHARLRVQFYPLEKLFAGKNFSLLSEVKILSDTYFESFFDFDSVTFHEKYIIHPDRYSAFKNSNYFRFLQSGNYVNSQHELVLIKNNLDQWVESQIGNLFFLKKDKWYTPPISAGCIDGVMRNFIMNNQKELEIDVSFKALTPKDLMQIDSFLVTNAFRGVMTVSPGESKNIVIANNAKAKDLQFRIANMMR